MRRPGRLSEWACPDGIATDVHDPGHSLDSAPAKHPPPPSLAPGALGRQSVSMRNSENPLMTEGAERILRWSFMIPLLLLVGAIVYVALAQ